MRRPSDRDVNWRPPCAGTVIPCAGQRSLHRFYPHACRLILQTHSSVQCTPPKNSQKLIDGSNKKTNKTNWVLGSDIYLYQETLYRSESCKRKLRKTSPCGPPGMATRVRPIYIVNATPVMPSPAGPPGCCLLHFLRHFFLSQFHYRDAK